MTCGPGVGAAGRVTPSAGRSGAKPQTEANERTRVSPAERSGPTKRPASDAVGGFAGAKPPENIGGGGSRTRVRKACRRRILHA